MRREEVCKVLILFSKMMSWCGHDNFLISMNWFERCLADAGNESLFALICFLRLSESPL